MPRYQFLNPFPQIFGDLHHGVNAVVEGLEHVSDEIAGSAVELHDGDFVTTDEPIVHANLHELDAAGAITPEITPPITPEITPEITPDPTPENTPAPEGAEQNTEVQP